MIHLDTHFNFHDLEQAGLKMLDIITPLYIMLLGAHLYIDPTIYAFMDIFEAVGKSVLFWLGAIASTTYAVGRAYLTLKEIFKKKK